jgi:hypothetical protein
MSRGLGKVQAEILNKVASWQWMDYESNYLGWVLPASDKSIFRAIKSLEKRGLVYRQCADGTQPRKQRIRRGKGFYTRYVCEGDTVVKPTPAGLSYWAEHIADTEII